MCQKREAKLKDVLSLARLGYARACGTSCKSRSMIIAVEPTVPITSLHGLMCDCLQNSWNCYFLSFHGCLDSIHSSLYFYVLEKRVGFFIIVWMRALYI